MLHYSSRYGYQPWWTVAWALGIVAAFGAVYGHATGVWGMSTAAPDFIQIAAGDVYWQGNEQGHEQRAYPAFNPFLYSLDVFIPILDLGMDDFWRPKTNWLYLLAVLEEFLGAFLVALAITGFTGLLSKEDQA